MILGLPASGSEACSCSGLPCATDDHWHESHVTPLAGTCQLNHGLRRPGRVSLSVCRSSDCRGCFKLTLWHCQCHGDSESVTVPCGTGSGGETRARVS
eukprot:3342917-Rhodomonas_salina.1